MTTSTAVSGVDSSSPIGPQSHVQKTAATSTASVDMPVLDPYSSGSTAWLTMSSIVTKSATVAKKTLLCSKNPNATTIGPAAPIHGPMYGTKRKTQQSK